VLGSIFALILALILVLPYKQSPFFSNTVEPMIYNLDFEPKLKNLISLQCGDEMLKVISTVAYECDKFGLLLDIDRQTIKIEWNSPINVESKCLKILEHWLDGRGKEVT